MMLRSSRQNVCFYSDEKACRVLRDGTTPPLLADNSMEVRSTFIQLGWVCLDTRKSKSE